MVHVETLWQSLQVSLELTCNALLPAAVTPLWQSMQVPNTWVWSTASGETIGQGAISGS